MIHSHANWPNPELILETHIKEILKAPFSSLVIRPHVGSKIFGNKSWCSGINTLMLGKMATTAGIEV